MLMGTPAYMAPEQARGDKMDARSDQYSLAVIIYQLFTGRLPFEGETPMQTAMKHLDEPVPPPQSVNPELSPALERVILTALSKDPQARFPSVRALNTAFLAALRGDPLTWLKPTRALQLDEKQPGQPRSGEEQGGRLVTRTLPLIGLLAAVLLAGGALFWLQEGEAMFPGGQAPEPTAEAGGSTLEGGTPTATPLPPTPTPVPTPL